MKRDKLLERNPSEVKQKLDMLFIHPPVGISKAVRILDASVAYTSEFVAIPVGLFSMANQIEKYGFKVKILNLGERVVHTGASLEELITQLISQYSLKIVGIDIHWMIHAAGAVETAKLIKKYSPETKIVIGGISASYFAEELVDKYRQIDYVMIGECDNAIVDLIRELSSPQPDFTLVPNLVYKNNQSLMKNPVILPQVNENLEITRYDLLIHKPLINPDRSIIPYIRGCYYNCCFCSGSRYSFQGIMKRKEPHLINPSTLVQLMEKNLKKGRNNIYIYGDIRDGGQEYVNEFFHYLNHSSMSGAHVVFEFFRLAGEDYVKKWREWADKKGNTLEVTHSPESANQDIRKQLGKDYTNEQLLNHCRLLIDYNIPNALYFLLGLPRQTRETVEETLMFADQFIQLYTSKFKRENLRHDVVSYNLMQIPDAGSRIFREPEKYGFHIDFSNIEELVKRISTADHWSKALAYHTDTLSRKEIIQLYYYIKETLGKIYHRHRLVTDEELENLLKQLKEDKKHIPPELQ